MWHAKQLIFHGAVILLVGLLCGAPFGRAIVRRKSEACIRAWRVAHSGLAMGGVTLLAVGAVVPNLSLSEWALGAMVGALVVSGYGFAIALPLGAHFGQRGLVAGPPPINRIVHLGNIIGAAGSIIGAVLLVWGAYAAL